MILLVVYQTVSVYDKNNVGGFGGGIDSIHDMIAGKRIGI